MPRIRQIKPDFYLDDELARCPRDARLMFPGLWCLADREGRLEDRPAKIKVQLFPYDDDIAPGRIDEFLDLLDHHNFILRYEVAGKRYIQIRTFEKHQHCHKKEPESQLPPPPARKIPGQPGASPEKHRTSPENTGQEPGKYGADSGYLEDAALKDVTEKPGASPKNTGQEPVLHRSSPAASGVLSIDNGVLSIGLGGGMGEGSKPPPSAVASKRLRRETNNPPPALPELLTDQMLEWCELAAPNIDPKTEAEKFLDYHLGQGTTRADWPATFRGWIRIAIERAKQSARGPTRRESVEEHNRRVFAELEAMDEKAIRVMQGLDPDRGSG